jgi:hypothetical protein
MDFLPWKTVDLDGAFRVTAPESIAEEVIQELSHAVTFRFNGDLNRVRLEILLTPPWGWEDCFPADEQGQPPARYFCRLISRSTGRRIVIPLEDDGLGLWFAEKEYTAILDGEEIRAEALLVRTAASSRPCEGLAHQKGQIVGRSRIHTVRFTSRTANSEALFQLRWAAFPSGASQQLWRLQAGEPPVLELNANVAAPLRRLLMSRSRRRSGAALQRDAIFMSICSAVWPLLVGGALNELQRIGDQERELEASDVIAAMSSWQSRLLGLFAAGLAGADLPPHAALPLLVQELRIPGGYNRLMLRMPALIQEETRLVSLAEAMADAQQVHADAEHSGQGETMLEAEAA